MWTQRYKIPDANLQKWIEMEVDLTPIVANTALMTYIYRIVSTNICKKDG